jgi:diguanylate cyclase (GGDEF)-like protein/PAS domain S-box-containing protein
MGIQETYFRVLLVESDQNIVEKIRSALTAHDNCSFIVEWAPKLSDALVLLNSRVFAAVLLDLSPSGGCGIDCLDKVLITAPHLPVLVLIQDVQEALAAEAVTHGAQDYLLPRHLDSYSLLRALQNSIERKSFMDELYAEKDRALVTLNSIGDAVLCTDLSGHITYLNPVAEKMTGWTHEEAAGLLLNEVFRIIDGTTRKPARDPLEMAVRENCTVGLTPNCVLIRRGGGEYAIEDSAAPIHDRTGSMLGAVIVFHDVSAARAMSLKMMHSAHHDSVTGLPNRLLLNDRISQAIVAMERQARPLAVMFLDLDYFKHINDSLGHSIGDELLQSIAGRLRTSLRGSDTISRQGGDEFVILLTEIANADDAARSAKRVLLALRKPHIIQGHTLRINGSIGISIYPNDGQNCETLLQNADTAMYHAKENGRNNFQFFTAQMNKKVVERLLLESSLRLALDKGEFVLNYQPKVNLGNGEITGCEALVRWERPGYGVVGPEQFVPVAEECGLIIQIGRWVLNEACRQARSWQDQGLPALPIAVNVSAIEFHHRNFIDGLRSTLAKTGLDAQYLELELTEGVLMKDAESTNATLMELKKIGVHLAVDDFGTGYSSLSYLQHFPIDTLKIDKSFIRQISADPGGSVLISAIIGMGKSLNHVVVAEGIETEDQKAYLQLHRCAEGQGYLFSRPVVATEFAEILRREHVRSLGGAIKESSLNAVKI